VILRDEAKIGFVFELMEIADRMTGPAELPERKAFHGLVASVTPLSPREHGDSLWNRTSGTENDDLWRYLPDGPFATREAFDEALRAKAASKDPLFYGIVERARNQALGYAALMRIEPAHRVIEIGGILFSKELQKSRTATESFYLLARYVFDDLQYRRFEWKCNTLNAPSRAAALRYGFSFEGIFRQHMIVRGQNRDTAWFSMLDSEWPARKAELERWLDPANFDEHGNQRTRLSRGTP
jgi:RimJ/RimL family protein N-acetyltransferase